MSNDIVTIANQAGLAESQTQQLLKSFGNYFEEARTIASGAKDIQVKDVSEVELMMKARKQRLALREVRINVENTRKELKEQSLREGKAIDGIANVIKALIIPVEDHLQLQEDFKKIQEEIAKRKLSETRSAELQQYDYFAMGIDLANMSSEAYESLLANTKTAFESRKEAEQKAEQERIDAEQRRLAEEKRLREENEKLKAESEKREAELLKERKSQEAELAKERAEQQKKLDAERKSREKIEAEMKAEREKQEADKRAQEELQRQKLLAPDKEKLLELAKSIDLFMTSHLPAVQSKKASELVSYAESKLADISDQIREGALNL